MSPEVRPQKEQQQTRQEPSGVPRTIFEIKTQQRTDSEDLTTLLADLGIEPEVNNVEPLTRRQWEQAVGKDLSFLGKGMHRTVYGVSTRSAPEDEAEPPQVPSFGLPSNERLALKTDKTWIAPQDQEVEADLNHALADLFPAHFPRVHQTLQVEVDGKKGSGTYTERVYFAPPETEAKYPFKDVEIILKEEIGLPRFLDSNVGNGLKDDRTGTIEESIVDRKSEAEVYVDDTGILIPSDILKSLDKILAFIDRNTGIDDTGAPKLYTEKYAETIKGNFAAFATKYNKKNNLTTAA